MQSGLVMLPGALAAAVAMPIVARLVRRISPRVLSAVGIIGSVIFMFLLTRLTIDTGPGEILWPMILRGAALGFMFLPMTLATLSALQGHEIAEGTALFNLSRQLAGSIGIAVLSTFLLHRETFHFERISEGLTAYNPGLQLWLQQVAGGLMLGGSPPFMSKQQALGVLAANVQAQAAVLSYNDIFLLMGIVLLAAMPLLLLFESGRAVHDRMRASAGE
jgi:DHA2 family multidrug resistance protein